MLDQDTQNFEFIEDRSTGQQLWLTPKLMLHISSSASMGLVLSYLGMLLAICTAIMLIFTWKRMIFDNSESFLLFERGNLFKTLILLFKATILYFQVRAYQEGLKAFKCLKNALENDDDLLEGTDRLGEMFRCYTILTIGYVLASVYYILPLRLFM
jgi:hypothetical protein